MRSLRRCCLLVLAAVLPVASVAACGSSGTAPDVGGGGTALQANPSLASDAVTSARLSLECVRGATSLEVSSGGGPRLGAVLEPSAGDGGLGSVAIDFFETESEARAEAATAAQLGSRRYDRVVLTVRSPDAGPPAAAAVLRAARDAIAEACFA